MKAFMIAAGVLAASLLAADANAQGARPALGVTMSDNTAGGVLLTDVTAGSPAALAGLRAGDRILSINGQKVGDYRDVTRLINANTPNAAVKLDVDRGGWRTTVNATLGNANQVFQAVPAPQFITVPVQAIPGGYYQYSPADIDDQHGYGSS